MLCYILNIYYYKLEKGKGRKKEALLITLQLKRNFTVSLIRHHSKKITLERVL